MHRWAVESAAPRLTFCGVVTTKGAFAVTHFDNGCWGSLLFRRTFRAQEDEIDFDRAQKGGYLSTDRGSRAHWPYPGLRSRAPRSLFPDRRQSGELLCGLTGKGTATT